MAALRIGIAAMLLTAMFQPWTLRLTASDWPGLLLYGVMIGAMNLLIYRAFAYIPVGIAISIEVLGPLAVAMITSRRVLDLLWIGFAALGLALLPLGSAADGLDPRGVAFALAAALCWGLYVAVGSRVAGHGNRGVAVGMVIASLVVLPFGIGHAGAALLEPRVLAFGLVVAALSSAMPFLLDLFALRHLPRSVFGVLMSASPAVSAVAGIIILHERLSVTQWSGIAAITLACVGTTTRSAREARRAALDAI
ncbi:EamA family transporter [Sphingomonas sp. KR1UV-12]|uniref:EamA family transporter n=1 Tax=Sphingomonas aurea TaxID=3063994 RepID=A0ABT9EMU5_9SPHN|nr:EamA family transporter [Sphingomonas sp. KR1UV-12]